MKHAMVLIVTFLIGQFLFAIPANLVPNLRNPETGIFTAGQPTDEGFQQLAVAGIKTVINVLPERYCVKNEQEVVRSAGMLYRTVPFQTSQFKKETVEQFADILQNAPKPVLIHCSTGNHAGGMWFAYRYLIEKRRLDDALMEGRMIGMKPDLEKKLVSWAMDQRDAM